jgi:hypothetical protein
MEKEHKNSGVSTNGHKQWLLKRDKILLGAGLVVIAATFIVTEFLSGPFHIEYLFVGTTLCGIGLAQGFDRSGRG